MPIRRYQVVIVGGGPVGTALAVELGQRGACAVIERHRDPQRIPKGQNLTQRTLEHFYFWNCVDELRSARLLPPGHPIGGITAYGNLMSPYRYASIGLESIQQFYFQKNERLPQYLTEGVLRDRAAELSNVHLLLEHTATAIEQDDEGTRVTVVSQSWPYGEEVLEADYIVGCDGSRSLVRRQLEIEQHGTDFNQRMVLAVFSSPELHEGLAALGNRTTYHVVNPHLNGAWQFFGRVEFGLSWFFHAPVRKNASPDDHDYIRTVMEQAAGFSFPVEFEHVGFWNLKIEVADTYRKGRIFIAGDAAHSHPPYGGFGLNSGLEDVTNLGWKLAAVLDGWGSEELLDSYSEERQPIFVETGEDVIAGGVLRERKWLESHDPQRDLADFQAAWSERSTETSARLSYEPHYEGSSVICGPEHSSVSVHSQHSFSARPGHHLAPQKLSSGHNVFEELGPGFNLLAFDATDEAVASFQAAARSLNIPMKVVSDTSTDVSASYGSSLILVRPDQFVAWSSDESDVDAAEVLLKVTGIS